MLFQSCFISFYSSTLNTTSTLSVSPCDLSLLPTLSTSFVLRYSALTLPKTIFLRTSLCTHTNIHIKMQTPVDHHPIHGPDVMRGRTRVRGHTRPAAHPGRTEEYESSTLRGRSRQRATSPHTSASRNPSSSLLSPPRHLILYKRFRESRREHCPSRVPSPSPSGASLGRRRRTRSRSRSRATRMDIETPKFVETHSSLRHEVHLGDDSDEQTFDLEHS